MIIFIYFGDYYLKNSQDAVYQGIGSLNRTTEQKRRNSRTSRGDLLVKFKDSEGVFRASYALANLLNLNVHVIVCSC
jgi:hypothetical protein